ncbi:MAG TPA: alpha/beta hydrolase [Gammaproteobacteria bacterium]
MSSPVHVTRWGEAGPRVVLIHGGVQGSSLSGAAHFPAQQRLAAQGFQLLVPDRPGHGKSASPGRPDDAAADGEWAAELLGDSAHLVGHSFGGCVALAAASRRPAAVRSLTLIEPAMLSLASHDPHVRRLMMKVVGTVFFSLSARARMQRLGKILGIPAEIRGTASAEEQTRMGKAVRRVVLPAKKTLELELAALRERGTPLLVVTGSWSPAHGVAGDTIAALGGGRHVVIRSPHHFPHLVSDEFNAQFLALAAQADR